MMRDHKTKFSKTPVLVDVAAAQEVSNLTHERTKLIFVKKYLLHERC